MASLPPSLRETLAYFDKYDYPLTANELWFWQHGTTFSKLEIRNFLGKLGQLEIRNWQLRRQRSKFSQNKWKIAKKVGESLKSFPTIAAVYVTGALAMNNCPANDDIDLMIVTYPHTLWLTRLFVVIYLKFLGIRRHPATEYRIPNTENQICDNLWLDIKNLKFKTKDLYVAHEILQAKVLWDRAHIHSQFLSANSWASRYLLVAYKESFRNLKIKNLDLIKNLKFKIKNFVLWPLNCVFFVAQYLYMKPKMTSEKVGLGFAFFHPSK